MHANALYISKDTKYHLPFDGQGDTMVLRLHVPHEPAVVLYVFAAIN